MRRLCLLFLFAAIGAASSPAADPIDFNRDVRRILSDNCFACHGPDEGQRPTELRLDVRDSAVAALESGVTAIVPGKPAESEIVVRITSDDEFVKMPPPDSHKKLTPREIELLTRWVEQGANYAPHWSYAKPERSPLPEVKDASWPRNPIDRFVLARMEAEGIAPTPEADRYTLCRRVYLDLTGLPPTPEEADAFVNDPSPDAYARLVDRLLADPAYGEHRARKWLDLARYADSAGYADDPPRTIWGYRDYVIRAFNANMPFDRFTIEQIAGDLLPEPTTDQLVATAFHRNTLTNNEGGTIDEEFRNVAVVDRVNTTAAVWMGTTMACAQCHTHKYDPITQTEYFEFFAFFNNTADADMRDESPLVELFTPQQKRDKAAWESEKRELEKRLSTPTSELLAGMADWEASVTAEPHWTPVRPTAVTAGSGAATAIADDASVTVAANAETDVYTVVLPVGGEPLTALRLEALPDDSLPGGGPGHGGGNFVLSDVKATITLPKTSRRAGRFVRIELPGKQRILALAEVQVFDGEENVALAGTASQSSTAFGGEAQRAIDGNTNGEYFDANSTTHTNESRRPWWEVDLKANRPIDRIALSNRTDGDLEDRLAGAKLTVLDADRKPVFETTIAEAPKPSAEVALGGPRPVPHAAVFADFSQDGFPASAAIDEPDPENTGWAIAPQQGKPHALTLIPKAAVDAPVGSTLTVTIEQASKHVRHTLGRFRFSVTADPNAAIRAALPQEVLASLAVPAEQRTAAQKDVLVRHYVAVVAPELQPVRDRLAEVAKSLAGLKPVTTVPVLKQLPPDQRRVTKLQHRGNYLDLGEVVTPGVPEAFPPLPGKASLNRLTLAKWLVSRKNPLTARVAVNRAWEELFGIDIVRPSEEFGSQGEPPSHPKLLDWLAVEYVESGWDTKSLFRLIVTSATYRQSADAPAELYTTDPENRLLARGPRFRLPAESVRDQALAAAGLLSKEMLGEPVRPPQPDLGLKAAFGGSTDWKTSAGEDRYRRGLYTTWRRSNPYPSMVTFDAPNREVCTLRRPRTNTPLQALVTLNDPVYVEAAQGLARRIVAGEGSPSDKAAFGFRRCVTRPATEAELTALVALYEDAKAEFAANPEAAMKLATDPLGPLAEGADVAEHAAWTVVANVLLNLDEMLAKP
ncbi:MAG: DUF1553 domain-containing protein [Planctomycetaceae bacterium]